MTSAGTTQPGTVSGTIFTNAAGDLTPVPWQYIIAGTVLSPRVLPNTLAAAVTPAFLAVSFRTSAAGNMVAGDTITLTSNVAIFQQASITIPISSVGSACGASTVSVSAGGTVATITLGPAGCTVASNADVAFRLPWQYLLPNPAVGTSVQVSVKTSKDVTPVNAPAYTTVTIASVEPQIISARPYPLSAGSPVNEMEIFFIPAVSLTTGMVIVATAQSVVPNGAYQVFTDWGASTALQDGITLIPEFGPPCNATGVSFSTNRQLWAQLGSCNIGVGLLIRLLIPRPFLQANPASTVTVRMALAVNGVETVSSVAYTTTDVNTGLSDLQFLYLFPSTTLLNTRPAWMFVAFVPAISVWAGGEVAIATETGTTVFQPYVVPQAQQPQPAAPLVAIGSCTSSTVTVRNRIITTIVFTLAPFGCVLPANEPVRFAIPIDYLVAPTSARAINAYLYTNMEPTPIAVQFSYTVGASSVKAFSVVPSTTLAGVVPTLTISVVLTTALTSANPTIYIEGRPGTFVDSMYLSKVSTNVAACSNVQALVEQNVLQLFLGPDSCYAAATANAQLTFTLSNVAPTVVQPNLPAGTAMLFAVFTDSDLAAINQTTYTTTATCGTGTALSVGNTVESISALSAQQRASLVSAMTLLSLWGSAAFQCTLASPSVWYFKITDPADAAIITSDGAPIVVVTNWGLMFTTPMYAIVISYPPTTASLQALGINTNFVVRALTTDYTQVFIVKIDRLTSTAAVANNNNPVGFQVNVLQVTQVVLYTVNGAPGITVTKDIGSWGQGPEWVLVYSSLSGVFIGLSQPAPSPVPQDDGSDEALYGLLALIAVPFLLLALLALAIWLLMRRRPAPCQPAMACCQQEYALVPMDCCTYPVVPTPVTACYVEQPAAAATTYLEPQPYW